MQGLTLARGMVMSLLLLVVSSLVHAGEPVDPGALAKQTSALLMEGKFAEAQPLVEQALQQLPGDLYFMAQLDVVLNGLGKTDEAAKLREEILKTWAATKKADWEAKGKPKGEATWLRMIVKTKAYTLLGTEYYEPEVHGPPSLPMTNYYKIIAEPIGGGAPRLFKLEMSKMIKAYHVLSEVKQNGFAQIVPYGETKPDLATVVKDLAKVLDKAPPAPTPPQR